MAAVAPSAFPVQSVADLQARFEAERAGTPFLLFQDEHGRQQIVGLENEPAEIPIGRDPEIGIPLPWDRQVSRVHALLHRVAGAWTILDDGLSRNGTLVNGERLSGRRRLHDRDVVRCGDVQIEFREPSAAEGEETHRAPRRRRSLAGGSRPLSGACSSRCAGRCANRARHIRRRTRRSPPSSRSASTPSRRTCAGSRSCWRSKTSRRTATRAAGVERAQLGTGERARATRGLTSGTRRLRTGVPCDRTPRAPSRRAPRASPAGRTRA
ncbi:MAG: hypothetical protein QOG94_2243 [Solirubrobacteraceae bacterium]|nr:hypothetical protein [Solirubrobacteraceae bacterium]